VEKNGYLKLVNPTACLVQSCLVSLEDMLFCTIVKGNFKMLLLNFDRERCVSFADHPVDCGDGVLDVEGFDHHFHFHFE